MTKHSSTTYLELHERKERCFSSAITSIASSRYLSENTNEFQSGWALNAPVLPITPSIELDAVAVLASALLFPPVGVVFAIPSIMFINCVAGEGALSRSMLAHDASDGRNDGKDCRCD